MEDPRSADWKALSEIGLAMGIVDWVDSDCATSLQNRDVVSTLRNALENCGDGVHVTESKESRVYIFSKKPLTKEELSRFESAINSIQAP